jgi:hypothetical protein
MYSIYRDTGVRVLYNNTLRAHRMGQFVFTPLRSSYPIMYSRPANVTTQLRIAIKSRETIQSGSMAPLREGVWMSNRRLVGRPIPTFFLALSCGLISGEVAVVAFSPPTRLKPPLISCLNRSMRLRMGSDPLSVVGSVCPMSRSSFFSSQLILCHAVARMPGPATYSGVT